MDLNIIWISLPKKDFVLELRIEPMDDLINGLCEKWPKKNLKLIIFVLVIICVKRSSFLWMPKKDLHQLQEVKYYMFRKSNLECLHVSWAFHK